MKTRYFVSKDKLYIVTSNGLEEAEEVSLPEEEEIEDDFEEEEENQSPKKKRKTRKTTTCSQCGKSGHTRRTCGNEVGEDLDNLKRKDSEDDTTLDEDIATDIRTMWAEQGQSALAVCNELNITLSKFNRIVEKFKIVKK